MVTLVSVWISWQQSSSGSLKHRLGSLGLDLAGSKGHF